jgi:hypothetical protein
MSFETLDFLTDASILDDPSPYYEYLRECPVRHVRPHSVVAVTGYDEAVDWKPSFLLRGLEALYVEFTPLD